MKAEAILEQWLSSQTAALPAEVLNLLNHVVKNTNEVSELTADKPHNLVLMQDPVLLSEALIISGKCYWYTERYKEVFKMLGQVKVSTSRSSSFHHHKLLIDYYAFYGEFAMILCHYIIGLL